MNFNRSLFKILLPLLLFSNNLFAHNTINYNAQNGIASNTVHKILKDHSNRIWVGTGNGLSIISSNGIKNVIFDKSWDDNEIWEIYEAPDSTIWIGTYKGGVYYYKNDVFKKLDLSIKNSNQIIRKIILNNNQLFIGGDGGLYVVNYNTKQLIEYHGLDNIENFQILNFFSIQSNLYFQTFHHGFFKIDLNKKTYKNIRHDYLSNYSIFNTQVFDDSIMICRGTINQHVPHNFVKQSTSDFLNNKISVDSIPLNTLAWKYTKDKTNNLLGACWGVNDISGGLYMRKSNAMVKVNEDFNIPSNQLWDIYYCENQNKLYVGSIDKGLYIVDLNDITNKNQLIGDQDILDIKIIQKQLYILTTKELIKIEDNKIVNVINYTFIDRFLATTQPFINLNSVFQDTPLSPKSIIDLKDQIGITSNKGLIYFDYNLKPLKYIHENGQVKVTILDNNDMVMSTDYNLTQLLQNGGKGLHMIFPLDIPINPRDITHSCKVNNNYTLFSSFAGKLYLYNQQNFTFKRFLSLDRLRLPCYIDRISENNIMFLDKANHLYEGTFEKDSFILKHKFDFESRGIVESYFMKRIGNAIIIGTNRGIFVHLNNKTYLINKSLGLPENVIYRTVQIKDQLLLIATSAGLYEINLNKLVNIKLKYDIDNIVVCSTDCTNKVSVGKSIQFNTDPNEFSISWEMNSHPYPENISYQYKINNDKSWHTVSTKGYITIQQPQYGINIIYLKVNDESDGTSQIVKLMSVDNIKPFHKRTIFISIIIILFISLGFFVFYRVRVKQLKQKERDATAETENIKQKMAVLQFLLKPHFLFNALTSIQNLIIEKDFDKSLTYTSYFSKFLRSILDTTSDDLICLNDELKNIENYVNLEKLRFNENVNLIIDIDPIIDIDNTYIVPFLFQPLLENTFKHGFNDKIQHPQIIISAKRDELHIKYTITDNGIGFGNKSLTDVLSRTKSKGLKIVMSQLNKYFPDLHSIELLDNVQIGAAWVISIYDKNQSLKR